MGRTKHVVLCDFDGTVTTTDVAESILQEYADGEWREVEERCVAGEIGTREAIRMQFAMVPAGRDELLAFADGAAVDPSFKDFVAFCRGRGIHLGIVSDGLDFYIRHILDREGLDLQFTANEAVFGGDGIEIGFPHGPSDCPECGRCGNCKLQTVKDWRAGGAWVGYVGDGHSDFWAARGADHVYARGPLLEMCVDEGLSNSACGSFADVRQDLEARIHD